MPQGAAVFLVAFLLIRPLTAEPSPESASDLMGRTILSIELAADHDIDALRYLEILRIKKGDVLGRIGLKAALQSLHDTGRFSSIAVEAAPQGEGVALRFQLQGNYYFNRFVVEGKVNLGGRAPWEVLALPVGERYAPEKLEEARQSMLRYMHERGYFLAQVQARPVRDEQSRQIDVNFAVTPGKLPTITAMALTGVPDQEREMVSRRFGFKVGKPYDRGRQRRRLDDLKSYLVKRGYLAAVGDVQESFSASANTVALTLKMSNFDRVRVNVAGFRIGKDRLRRLLPILAGEGLGQEVLREGAGNLREYMEEQGYPEAEAAFSVKPDKAGGHSVLYTIVAGRKVTVRYLRFKGNQSVTSAELLTAVETQPAGILQKSAYSVSRLDADVASLTTLYKSRGFLDAVVIPLVEPIKDGAVLGITFVCNEGPRALVNSISIQGNRALDRLHLEAGMKSKPGAPYSPYIAEQDRQTILARYNDAGFLQPAVSVNSVMSGRANLYEVAFEIQEGIRVSVDRIIVLGNDATRDSVIARRIQLKEQEPLSMRKVLSTQQALYKLGVFDLVRVAPQNPSSIAASQNVVVRLQESKRFTLRYGVGYQTHERLRGTVELSDLNLLGRARRIDMRLRGSAIEQSGLIRLAQPQTRFIPVDSYFTLSGRNATEVSFDSRRLEASYQFGRPVHSHSWALLRYNFSNVRISGYDKNLTPDELGRENTPRNLSTFSVFYMNDTRDNYLDAEKGFFTSSNVSVTTKLLGSNDYFTLYTQNSYFRKLPASTLLASSLRLGFSHPFGGDTELPLSERFFAGGGSSLRGFDTDMAGPLNPATNRPLGGNALIIANLELRLPLMRSLQLVPFYDTGNVFSSLDTVRLSGFTHTLGLGLRIRTPFGPLRADYGLNLNLSQDLRSRGLKSGHFFITIGPPF
jgi:outer membrane protein insertion porin family